MKINSNYQQYTNFGEKFKTKDVLSFISGYPISNNTGEQRIEERIIKSMTGIDINGDSFKKAVSSDITMGEIVLQSKCIEELGNQNSILKEADATADDIFCKVSKDKNAIKQWTNKIIKKAGTEVDIQPFKFSYDDLRSEYHKLLKAIEQLNIF